jgi:YaiO family outer membrane protein
MHGAQNKPHAKVQAAARAAVQAALLAAVCASAPAGAAEPPGTTTIGVDLENDSLSNGSDDWRMLSVRVKRDIGPRQLVEVSLDQTHRFGLRDNQAGIMYAWPISAALSASIDAHASSTHRVLPGNDVTAALQYEFAPAWLVHGGFRTTGYDDVRANQAQFMLEHYVGSFSWALGWRPTRAFGVTANSGELRGAYYYGDKSSLGLSYAAGRETTSTASGIVLAEVRALALIGHHWFAPSWAFNYAIGSTHQGDFYTRKGVSIGLAHTF